MLAGAAPSPEALMQAMVSLKATSRSIRPSVSTPTEGPGGEDAERQEKS